MTPRTLESEIVAAEFVVPTKEPTIIQLPMLPGPDLEPFRQVLSAGPDFVGSWRRSREEMLDIIGEIMWPARTIFGGLMWATRELGLRDMVIESWREYWSPYFDGQGMTAMQFACTYPEMVVSLIVADIAPKYYPPHHDYILKGLMALTPADLSSRTAADEALSAHIRDWGIRQFLLKNLY